MKKLFVTIILTLVSLGIVGVWITSYISTWDFDFDNSYHCEPTRVGSTDLYIELFPGLIDIEFNHRGSKEAGDEFVATPKQKQYLRIEDIHVWGLDLGSFVFLRNDSHYDVGYIFTVPCWALFFLAVSYPAFRLGRGVIQGRKRKRASLCRQCNYNLTGNESGYCPECGEAVSRETVPTAWQRWAKRPTLVEHVTFCGISCYGILGVSDPTPWNESWLYLITGFIEGSVWIWLVYVYCVSFITCRLSGRVDDGERKEPMRKGRLIAGACYAFLFVSSLFYSWPLFLRFRLSQEAFDTALRDFRAGKFDGGSWVGLYYVHSVQDNPSCDCIQTVIFRTGGTPEYPLGFEYDWEPDHYSLGYGAVQVSSFWYTYDGVW